MRSQSKSQASLFHLDEQPSIAKKLWRACSPGDSSTGPKKYLFVEYDCFVQIGHTLARVGFESVFT